MRRFIRDRIIELLGTVRKGAEYGLMDDCTVALSSIGNTLKENLSAEAFAKYDGRLDIENMDVLEYLLLNESEIQKEVVFFPYKISMWDSLESVWFAAKDDPNCYVSVVPIPYYEIENGAAMMHYEGELYPDYVPVTDWQKYDLATVRPDVAYIHNAYDDHNLVTQVEPRYFTRNLKQYVDLLVYVPYYASDSRPSPGFASTPAVCSADIMIASSEMEEEAYRMAGAKLDIAVLGSPKIDRIVNMRREKPPLPTEWNNLHGKKVFFLNTSVGSMLIRTEFYFDKLRQLFALFEKRDDIALLWRPHPLTKATINSMRPMLQEQFRELEHIIYMGSFGVLDESPDMGVAIGISDAYIGDGSSSLVYLYALTGKPMYILNFKMPMAPDTALREELLHSDIIGWSDQTDSSEKWGICASVNALCKIDLKTTTAKFVASFPSEKNIGGLYAPPINVGNKLLFSPVLARNWAFYDIESGQWEKRAIPPETVPKLVRHAAFGGGIRCADAIIFLPGASGIVARYDMNSGKFSYYTELFQKIEEHIVNIDWGFISGWCENNDYLYFSSPQCNIVIELNTKTMQFRFYEVGARQNRYFQITFAGGKFWLTKFREPGLHPWKEGIVVWKRGTHKVKEYADLPAEQGNPLFTGSGFLAIRSTADSVFALPYQTDAIVKFDPKKSKWENFKLDPPYDYFERKSPYYTWADETALVVATLPQDDKIIASLPYDYSIMTIDLKTGKRSERKKWRIEGIEHLWQNLDRLLPTPWAEYAFLTPSDFIEKVVLGVLPAFDEDQAKYYRSINENSDGSCGTKIHEYVISKLKGGA